MNRLAFRIYDPEKRLFVYSGSTPSMLTHYFCYTATLVTVHNMEHQQLVGYEDKNGQRIYEGDRIRIYAKDFSHSFEETITDMCCLFVGDPATHWEVVGNIIENPKLSEVTHV